MGSGEGLKEGEDHTGQSPHMAVSRKMAANLDAWGIAKNEKTFR
jgi:hypothetical protein